jgi:hypothetical protein
MKMRWLMIIVVHPNHDPEKSTDTRHTLVPLLTPIVRQYIMVYNGPWNSDSDEGGDRVDYRHENGLHSGL